MTRGLAHLVQAWAAPFADHIWQSTILALLAAGLTLALKTNPARHRFTIWFIASVKFLLPFALLVHIGHALGAERRTPSPRFFVLVLETAGQPFSDSGAPLVPPSIWHEELAAVVPALLGVLWLAGVAGMLVLWSLRWLQVSRIRHSAEPMDQGLEFDFLRSLTQAAGITPIPILLSKRCLEPGIFGIHRPVFLWPAELSSPHMGIR